MQRTNDIAPEGALLREGEALDDLMNGYYLIQSERNFRFGIDAVLLSDYVRLKKKDRVIDFGCGNGIIPILMAAKTECENIMGLEIQESSADLAERSVKLNHLEDRISIVRGDIKEAAPVFGAASFDVVVSNPPYMIGQQGLTNPDQAKAIARHEILCTFDDLAKNASIILKPRGKLYLVHRPFRLAEIMKTLIDHRLEPKRMRLVYPYIDKEPNMVLIEAVKGGNSRIKVEPPLVVYKEPGVYTEEIRRIYGLE